MTDVQGSTLVFKDAAGDYFLLPQEALERGRVPVERKAEVERLLGMDGAGGDDVQGHSLGAALGFVQGYVAGAVYGNFVGTLKGFQGTLKGLDQ